MTKSWQLSYICGCRLNPVGFQGTCEGAEVPGFLAFWDKGRISLCRPERRVPNKRPVLSSLKDSCTLIIRAKLLCSMRAAPPGLTYAASVSMLALQVRRLWRKAWSWLSQGSLTFSSVHHWSQSSPISSGSVVQLSSSPLLLLPLFFLGSLSSNSNAIQELRCDPNAASSVIKRISSEDGFCHLNCLFWAHVTSNSPCVALLSGNNMNSCQRVWCNDPQSQLVHYLSLLFIIKTLYRDARHNTYSVWLQLLHAAH